MYGTGVRTRGGRYSSGTPRRALRFALLPPASRRPRCAAPPGSGTVSVYTRQSTSHVPYTVGRCTVYAVHKTFLIVNRENRRENARRKPSFNPRHGHAKNRTEPVWIQSSNMIFFMAKHNHQGRALCRLVHVCAHSHCAHVPPCRWRHVHVYVTLYMYPRTHNDVCAVRRKTRSRANSPAARHILTPHIHQENERARAHPHILGRWRPLRASAAA